VSAGDARRAAGDVPRHARRRAGAAGQRGVGLIEVLIALAILVFGALVSARMQVGALTGLAASELHFTLNRLAEEMIETLRTHPDAAGRGLFDHDSASAAVSPEGVDADGALSRPDRIKADWHARVIVALPSAESAITCADDFCTVQISWLEEIDGTHARQRFRVQTPL